MNRMLVLQISLLASFSNSFSMNLWKKSHTCDTDAEKKVEVTVLSYMAGKISEIDRVDGFQEENSQKWGISIQPSSSFKQKTNIKIEGNCLKEVMEKLVRNDRVVLQIVDSSTQKKEFCEFKGYSHDKIREYGIVYYNKQLNEGIRLSNQGLQKVVIRGVDLVLKSEQKKLQSPRFLNFFSKHLAVDGITDSTLNRASAENIYNMLVLNSRMTSAYERELSIALLLGTNNSIQFEREYVVGSNKHMVTTIFNKEEAKKELYFFISVMKMRSWLLGLGASSILLLLAYLNFRSK